MSEPPCLTKGCKRPVITKGRCLDCLRQLLRDEAHDSREVPTHQKPAPKVKP